MGFWMRWVVARAAFGWCIALTFASTAHADFLPWGKADERAFIAGRSALEDGMFEVARQNLEAYISEMRGKQGKARASVLLAECLHALGRYEDAILLLADHQKGAQRAGIEANFSYWKARCYQSLGEPDRALALLAKAEENGPGSASLPAVMQLAAAVLIEIGDYDGAADKFAEFLAAFPDREDAAEVALERAKVFIECGRNARALEALVTLGDDYPAAVAALEGALLIGKLLRLLDDVGGARAALFPLATNLQVRVELRAEAWFEFAEMEREAGDFENADHALAQGILLTGDAAARARAQADRGRILVLLGREEEGFSIMRESVLNQPDPVAAAATQISFAEMLQQQDKHGQAVQEYQVFMEAFSGQGLDSRALWGKAWSLWDLGRFTEAASVFEKVYALNPDQEMRADSLMKAADSHFAEGQFNAAAEIYRRFSEEFQTHAQRGQARFQEAESFAQAEDFDRAIELLEDIARESAGGPEAGTAAYRRALMLERAKRYEDAVLAYSELLETGGKEAIPVEAMHRRGIVRFRQGEYEIALDDFSRVVELAEPGLMTDEANQMRGEALYMLQRDTEALTTWQNLIETNPDSPLAPVIRFRLGVYQWNIGDYVKAEDQFLSLFQTTPENELAEQALYLAARSAEKLSNHVQALDHSKTLIRAYPDSALTPKVRILQGEILREMGRFSMAIISLDQIIQNWPDSPLVDHAWGLIGDCQRTLGTGTNGAARAARFQEALDSFGTVVDSPAAPPEMKLQAKYKIGRVIEHLDLPDDALDAYTEVVYAYLSEWATGHRLGSLYFEEAALRGARMLEQRGETREAINLLRQVVNAKGVGADQAEERIQKILEQDEGE